MMQLLLRFHSYQTQVWDVDHCKRKHGRGTQIPCANNPGRKCSCVDSNSNSKSGSALMTESLCRKQKKASLWKSGVIITSVENCGGWDIRGQTHQWTNSLVRKHTIDLFPDNKNSNAVSTATGRRRFGMIGAMFSFVVSSSLCCWGSARGPQGRTIAVCEHESEKYQMHWLCKIPTGAFGLWAESRSHVLVAAYLKRGRSLHMLAQEAKPIACLGGGKKQWDKFTFVGSRMKKIGNIKHNGG